MIRFAGNILPLSEVLPKTTRPKFVKVSQIDDSEMGNEMMSQEQAIKNFMPMIEAYGKDYEKFTKIKARPAELGELVVTVTSDGKETENTAKEGDFVVTNLGGSGEEYILSGDKLAKRYKEVGDGIYQATGECRGVQYSGPDTQFEASWGEPMMLKSGDMIVTPLPQKGEVYRIAKKEFELTYREKIV